MALYSFAYNGIIDAAVNKQSASTYIDLLGLVMASQLLSIFTGYAWLLLAVVCMYIYTYLSTYLA